MIIATRARVTLHVYKIFSCENGAIPSYIISITSQKNSEHTTGHNYNTHPKVRGHTSN